MDAAHPATIKQDSDDDDDTGTIATWTWPAEFLHHLVARLPLHWRKHVLAPALAPSNGSAQYRERRIYVLLLMRRCLHIVGTPHTAAHEKLMSWAARLDRVLAHADYMTIARTWQTLFALSRAPAQEIVLHVNCGPSSGAALLYAALHWRLRCAFGRALAAADHLECFRVQKFLVDDLWDDDIVQSHARMVIFSHTSTTAAADKLVTMVLCTDRLLDADTLDAEYRHVSNACRNAWLIASERPPMDGAARYFLPLQLAPVAGLYLYHHRPLRPVPAPPPPWLE